MSRFLKDRWKDLLPYIPGEQSNEDIIKLNTNESPFEPSPKILEILKEKSEDIINNLKYYPDPEGNEIKGVLKSVYDGPDFFIANGSDDVLATIWQAYGYKDKVYFPELGYGFYPIYGGAFDSDIIKIELEDDFSIDIEKFFNNDGMIIIANPNAPTGLALDLEDIERILKENPDYPVIIDEAYIDFGAESAIVLLKDYENLIVTRTLSKSSALAGLRFGFAIANIEIIEDLNRIQSARNPYPVGSISQRIAIESIKDQDYFNENNQKIIENREWISEKLRGIGFDMTDSKANFIWIKPKGIGAKELFESLRNRNILTRYFDGEKTKDYNRITIGSKKDMEILFDEITKIIGV